jgi:SAM-dependent methyltransferase
MEESSNKVYGNEGNLPVLNLVPAGSKYILDIGCGNGSNAKRLFANGYIIDGITLSEKEKEEALPFMRNVYVYNVESGLPIQGEGLYDVVICSHVLEHICYPQKLLHDIHHVLKTGGSFIIALPNLMHYKSRLQLLYGNFNYEDAGIWDYTHFRWYTFKTAQQLFTENGFEIELATVTGDLPFNSVLKKILLPKTSEFIYSFLIKISKGFFGHQLLYVVRKK